MLRIIISGFVIFLTSCAGGPSGGHYTQSIQSWRGSSTSKLISVWGSPDERIKETSGRTLYVYTKESFSAEQKQYSPQVGITGSRGRPVVVNTNDINEVWNKGLTLKCSVMFIANKQGVITHTKVLGNDCVISSSLANPR